MQVKISFTMAAIIAIAIFSINFSFSAFGDRDSQIGADQAQDQSSADARMAYAD